MWGERESERNGERMNELFHLLFDPSHSHSAAGGWGGQAEATSQDFFYTSHVGAGAQHLGLPPLPFQGISRELDHK